MTDDFSNYPKSIGESRPDSNAALWTPREALISVLRAIDSGDIDPDALVVCYRETKDKGEVSNHYCNSSPDVHVALGLLSYTSMRIAGVPR